MKTDEQKRQEALKERMSHIPVRMKGTIPSLEMETEWVPVRRQMKTVRPDLVGAFSAVPTVRKIRMNCAFCDADISLDVPKACADAYEDERYLVQEAFPFYNADVREMLISCICLECQKNIFGEEEEE